MLSHQKLSETFNLILLGTETLIEDQVNKMPGYERGETLNAIFNTLNGTEFSDKHIVSGTDRLATTVHTQVLEAVWMALKAISEGKKTIKIAAHSRGGVSAILFAHVLEKTLECLKQEDMTEANFKVKLSELVFNFNDAHLDANIDKRLLEGVQIKDQTLTFNTLQKKCDKQSASSIKEVSTSQQINLQALLRNAKNKNIRCDAMLIDPVPGQQINFIEGKVNWIVPAFFTLPNIIEKIDLIYMNDERSGLFDPIMPNHFNRENYNISTLYGNHGTASGWLTEQDVSDKNPTKIADEIKEEEGKKTLKGKKTRHTQKIMAAKLVGFFGKEAFRKPTEAEDKRLSGETLPHITKAIFSAVKDSTNLEKHLLKLYNKSQNRAEEYKKLRDGGYIPYFRYSNRFILNHPERGDDGYIELEKVGNLAPLSSYVNEEHLKLAIKHSPPQQNESALELKKQEEWKRLQDAELKKREETTFEQHDIYKDAKTAESALMRKKLNKLMTILNAYESAFKKNPKTADLDKEKLSCIQKLKDILLTKKSYKERASEFLLEVERISKLPTMKQHRTPLWERFLADLLSCLSVFPALYRALQCNRRFKRFTIFKPNSENLINRLDEVVKAPLPPYRVRVG